VADYLPRVALTGNRIQGSGRTTIVIPQGVLGFDGTGAPVPGNDRRFQQGATSLTLGQLSLNQPVTQLFRIRQANALAAAQVRGAEAAQAQTERDIALGVERLYVAALIAREKAQAMEVALLARRRKLTDADGALAAGTAIQPQAQGAQATTLEAEYALLAAQNEAQDLESELRDLLALPSDLPLTLDPPALGSSTLLPLDEYVALALARRPEVASAAAQQSQARRATALAVADYIPDIGLGVTYTYQHGVAFLPEYSAALTVQGSWTLWDFGKRAAATRERRADAAAATLALEHARDRAVVEVEKAYRKAERALRAATLTRRSPSPRRSSSRQSLEHCSRGTSWRTPPASVALRCLAGSPGATSRRAVETDSTKVTHDTGQERCRSAE
jgi:outer membrane protein TolC